MRVLINSGRISPFLNTRRELMKSISKSSEKLIITGSQTEYKEELKKQGAYYQYAPVKRTGLNPIDDIKLLFKYYNIIKKEKIDIVHSYTIKPNIFGSIAAKLAGVKNVYPTLNGIGFAFTSKSLKSKMIRPIASILYWISFKCSRKVFFHNQDDINEMVSRKLIKNKKCILLGGSGINLTDYPLKEMPEKFSFVLISRLLKEKGIIEYLEAAKMVKKLYPNIEFKLVGPFDLNPSSLNHQDIEPYIKKGIVIYYGEQKDVKLFLEESTVVVLPSYREGLPHVLLEGMATGRAIITTEAPGCKETVQEGVNGFLVPVKNVDKLTEKMIWMINNSDKVIEMGKQSYLIAKTKFEVSKVNNKILNTMKIDL